MHVQFLRGLFTLLFLLIGVYSMLSWRMRCALSKYSLLMTLLVMCFPYKFCLLCGRSGTSRIQIPQLPHTLEMGSGMWNRGVGSPVIIGWVTCLSQMLRRLGRNKTAKLSWLSAERIEVMSTLWDKSWCLMFLLVFMGPMVYCQQAAIVLLRKFVIFHFVCKGS